MNEHNATEQAYKHGYEKGRAEAIKEFAERLKKIYENHIVCTWTVLNPEIDNLVQEMVGDIELNEYIDTLVQEMVDQQRKEDEGNEHI